MAPFNNLRRKFPVPVCRVFKRQAFVENHWLLINVRGIFFVLLLVTTFFAEGNMFIATRNDLHSLKPVIARAEVLPPGTSSTRSFSSASSASLLPLKTQPDWLVDSRFAGVVESGDKLYVFFREEASEASNQIDKVRRCEVFAVLALLVIA